MRKIFLALLVLAICSLGNANPQGRGCSGSPRTLRRACLQNLRSSRTRGSRNPTIMYVVAPRSYPMPSPLLSSWSLASRYSGRGLWHRTPGLARALGTGPFRLTPQLGVGLPAGSITPELPSSLPGQLPDKGLPEEGLTIRISNFPSPATLLSELPSDQPLELPAELPPAHLAPSQPGLATPIKPLSSILAPLPTAGLPAPLAPLNLHPAPSLPIRLAPISPRAPLAPPNVFPQLSPELAARLTPSLLSQLAAQLSRPKILPLPPLPADSDSIEEPDVAPSEPPAETPDPQPLPAPAEPPAELPEEQPGPAPPLPPPELLAPEPSPLPSMPEEVADPPPAEEPAPLPPQPSPEPEKVIIKEIHHHHYQKPDATVDTSSSEIPKPIDVHPLSPLHPLHFPMRFNPTKPVGLPTLPCGPLCKPQPPKPEQGAVLFPISYNPIKPAAPASAPAPKPKPKPCGSPCRPQTRVIQADLAFLAVNIDQLKKIRASKTG